uniref:Uncharacterized protein n=1 Tax=Anopheles darlingi TaxID=43151 RepID=A0A2M4DQT5_ANODA
MGNLSKQPALVACLCLLWGFVGSVLLTLLPFTFHYGVLALRSFLHYLRSVLLWLPGGFGGLVDGALCFCGVPSCFPTLCFAFSAFCSRALPSVSQPWV